jgi:hypothetical protein
LPTTNETEIKGAKRGENEAVLVPMPKPSKKGHLFARRGVFSLDLSLLPREAA